MKPFIAFKSSQHQMDVGFRIDRSLGGGTGVAYVDSGGQKEGNDWQGPEYCLWQFDRAEEARGFCQLMAARYPSVHYAWAETKGMFMSQPTAPKESSVSAKGVLPV